MLVPRRCARKGRKTAAKGVLPGQTWGTGLTTLPGSPARTQGGLLRTEAMTNQLKVSPEWRPSAKFSNPTRSYLGLLEPVPWRATLALRAALTRE